MGIEVELYLREAQVGFPGRFKGVKSADKYLRFNLLRGIVNLCQGKLWVSLGHREAGLGILSSVKIGENLCVFEDPRLGNPLGTLGHDFYRIALGLTPIHDGKRLGHIGFRAADEFHAGTLHPHFFDVVFADIPDAPIGRINEIDILEDLIRFDFPPLPDALGQFFPLRSPIFVQIKEQRTQERSHHEVRSADSPDIDPGCANGHQLIMARVVGDSVKQRQEQGRRQDQHQKLRYLGQAVKKYPRHSGLIAAQIIHSGEEVKSHVKGQTSGQAEKERDQKLPE